MNKNVIKAVAVMLFVLTLYGCEFTGNLFPELTTAPTTVPTTVPTTAETTTEEPTTLKQYDFSGLKYASGKAAVCYDLTEDRILYERNADARLYPASLTKIVTVCVALKYLDPASVFVVGDEINFVGKNSSLCFILKGHAVTLYDLLHGMMLASGNDAAYTVAVNVARAVTGKEMTDAEAVTCFAGMMNDFCKEQGMKNSHFVNPEGWDNDDEYTSASDLVKAIRYALTYDIFREVIAKSSYHAQFVSGQTVDWKNSNLMLDKSSPYYVNGVCGVKTGTTSQAGRCLAALYKDKERELLIVSMGNETEDLRYYSVKELIETVKGQKKSDGIKDENTTE